MKILLAGHEGSKHIISACSYLLSKYLPPEFEIQFLNYGAFDGKLYAGEFVSLAEHQIGGVDSWGKYIAQYIKEFIQDELVIFALDDYLFKGHIDFDAYAVLVYNMMNRGIVAARLCSSDFYGDSAERLKEHGKEFVVLKPHARYSATTQYTIWRREFLIDMLEHFSNPWTFEIEGSEHLNAMGGKVIGAVQPVFPYDEHSCLSERWPGRVKVVECQMEDVAELIQAGHLNKEYLL